MKQSLIQIFVALLVFILIIFGILNNAIKDGRFVCNRYILNTYLYVILAFNIIAIQMLLMDYNNITFRPSFMLFIGIFIITIACIFIMHSITPDKLILKHCVWLIFMLLLGLIFYPMYSMTNREMIVSAISTTLLLFLGLSAIAYSRPDLISFSWGPVLLMLLIGGIILELSFLAFLPRNVNNSMYLRMMSYFFIGVFMVFIMYDTKRLMVNAKKCVIADYIQESLKLFLDLYNIFIRLLSLRFR